MGFLGVERVDGKHLRKYSIEEGDQLARICINFGQPDWKSIYNLPENKEFRKRFANPDKIQKAPNGPYLFIPLVGGHTSNKTYRIKYDAIVASFVDKDGNALNQITLKLLSPKKDHKGDDTKLNKDGDLTINNPTKGAYEIAAVQYELLEDEKKLEKNVEELNNLPTDASGKIDPASHQKLVRNEENKFWAWKVYFLRCPMCGTYFRTIQPASGSNLCPNDGFDITSNLEKLIDSDPKSFIDPSQGGTRAKSQDPFTNWSKLTSRSTMKKATAHGDIDIFWDESRFLDPSGDDFKLFGNGRTVEIVGRKIWSAKSPTPAKGSKAYDFHFSDPRPWEKAPKTLNPFYVKTPIRPDSENRPLDEVLHWITVHHTHHSQKETPSQLQDFDFTKSSGGGASADITYQFMIATDGKIFEGRPLGIEGVHVSNFNAGNIGIVLMGDYEGTFYPDTFTPDTQNSLELLVDVLAARFNATDVDTHQQRDIDAKSGETTQCPGKAVIPFVQGLRKKYTP